MSVTHNIPTVQHEQEQVQQLVEQITWITDVLPYRVKVACIFSEKISKALIIGVKEAIRCVGGDWVVSMYDNDMIDLSDKQQLDVLLMFDCNNEYDTWQALAQQLQNEKNWKQQPAVQENKMFVLQIAPYLANIVWVKTIEMIAEILHPELFMFGHRNQGWQPALQSFYQLKL